MPKAEGKKFKFLDTRAIRPDYLESFEFDGKNEYIATATGEFSAVCPFSGLPDMADLIIEYFPDGGLCVELKSLKYYIVSYRNVGLYQEGVTKRIHDDLKKLLKTKRLRVTTKYYPRGGFYTMATIGSLKENREIPFHLANKPQL
ncbi:MAG: preQ(1) synthase [Elusimicrobiaceae bacterium]